MPLRESDLDFDTPPSRQPERWVRLRAPVSRWLMGHCLEWNVAQLKGLVKAGEKNVPVTMRLGSLVRESTLLPAGPGRVRLITPVAQLRAMGSEEEGSEVEVELRRAPPRQPPAELPDELTAALLRRPGGMELFRAQSPSNQRGVVRLLAEVKSEESRKRRAEKMVERIFELAAAKKQK